MKLKMCFLSAIMLVGPLMLYAEKPSVYPKDKIIYEIDAKRASDLEQAWGGLQRYIDRDHYVAVYFSSGGSQYKNYKLVELSRYGALVNIKLENLEDDDIWTVLTIRASTILKLQIVEED
jgi:hypothetical protein